MLDSSSHRLRQAAQEFKRRRVWVLIGGVFLIVVWGIGGRLIDRAALGKETAEAAIPTVVTIKPNAAGAAEDLVLPGNVQAYNQAAIFA